MVAAVLVDALVLNARQRYLAGSVFPGPSPFAHSLRVAAEVFPESRVVVLRNEECPPALLDAPGTETLAVRAGNDRTLWSRMGGLLSLSDEAVVAVLSPFKGVVSELRARAVAAAFAAHEPRLARSAMRQLANAHPSYSRFLPAWCSGQESCALEEGDEQLFNPDVHVSPELGEHFPHISRIPGSQWLPELYRSDGAVCLCRAAALSDHASARAEGVHHCVVQDDEASPVMAYRLPVFLFHEDVPLRSPGVR